MKAKRRHELKENELAKDLSLAEDYIRRQWKSLVVGALVVVVLVLIIVSLVQNRAQTRQAERQTYQSLLLNHDALYGQALAASSALKEETDNEETQKATRTAYLDTLSKLAQTRQELRSLASKTSQKDLAALAYAQAGQMAYAELILRSPELSQDDRKALADEAQGDFRQVLNQYGSQKAAAGLAHFGLGLLAETQRDFTAARKEYEQAEALGKEGLRWKEAAEKIKLLDSSELSKVMKFPASAPAEPQTQPETQAADAQTQPATEPTTALP